MAACDLLIITAANEQQARQYRRRLAASRRRGPLRDVARTLVLADPMGRRVGSGAATLAALLAAARLLGPEALSLEHAFAGRRVLVLHSGGDSRRLPAYAAAGKLFAPTPCLTREGLPATLFDLVLEDFLAIRWPVAGGVLVAAGDVLLNLARCAPDLGAEGVTAVACPGDLDRAARHGVYVAAPARQGRSKVRDFLQKADAATLRARGALDERGGVAIDTGVLMLSPAASDAWLRAAGAGRRAGIARGSLLDLVSHARCAPMDLYVHSIMAITPAITRASFAATIATTATNDARRELLRYRDQLRRERLSFHVERVPSDFIHVGTTREFMHATLEPSTWRSLIAPRDDRRLLHAAATVKAPRDAKVVVEGARAGVIRCEGDALVVGVDTRAAMALPAATGLSCVRVGAKAWACVAFGLDDDCKTRAEVGGRFAAFDLSSLATRLGLPDDALFPPGEERSLWTARLWRPGPKARALQEAQQLLRGIAPSNAWKRAARIALADLVRLAHADTASHAIDPMSIPRLLEAGARPDLRRVAVSLRGSSRRAKVARSLEAFIRSAPAPLAEARAIRLRSMLDQRTEHAGDALAAVRRGVEQALIVPARPEPLAIASRATVAMHAPVRIDLAGGWSDTPPICQEEGGAVVNMAVLLGGIAPIRATVRRLDHPIVRIRSLDLARSLEAARTDELALAADGPSDWATLPKAALILSGLVPASAGDDLTDWLRTLGGGHHPCGIDLSIEAAVPKGSGLGTSSILACTLLAALDAFRGRATPDLASLARRTTLLEQMMGTGGGWQDQCGGLHPGVKCATTSPGADQSPRVEPLRVGPRCRAMLQSRAILVFTGIQRVARDILHHVVCRHLDGDPAARRIFADLRDNAMAMRHAIATLDDPDLFTRELARYWSLKRAIDPGAYDARVARRVEPLLAHAAAAELPGAGGGGFLFMIAKDARHLAAARRLIERLGRDDPAVREHAWSVAGRGLAAGPCRMT
jgi:fucokinase